MDRISFRFAIKDTACGVFLRIAAVAMRGSSGTHLGIAQQ